MPSPVIAPWLIPADPLHAAQVGSQLGLDYRGQNIQANEHASSLAEAAQEHAASLAQAAKEAQAQQELERQKITGGLAEAKARSDMEATLAARKFQGMQDYQKAIAGGVDPSKAAMQFYPMMSGGEMGGFGQLALEQFKREQAAQVPQPVYDDNNNLRAYTFGNVMHPVNTPRAAAAKIGAGLKARLDAAVKAVSQAVLPKDVEAAQKRLDDIANEADQAMSGEGSASSPQQDDPLGLFTK